MFCSDCNRFLDSLQEFPTFEIVFANDLEKEKTHLIMANDISAVIDYFE